MEQIATFAQQQQGIGLGQLWTAVGPILGAIVSIGGIIVWVIVGQNRHTKDTLENLNSGLVKSNTAITQLDTTVNSLGREVSALSTKVDNLERGVERLTSTSDDLRNRSGETAVAMAKMTGMYEARLRREDEMAVAAGEALERDPDIRRYVERGWLGPPVVFIVPWREPPRRSD